MQLDINPKTKINYKKRLERLNEAGYDWDSDIYETEYFFENVPIQTKQDLLTIIIVLRRDMDFSELRKKIQKQYAEYRDNKLENLSLMTTDEFVSRLNELYKRGMYEQFVLNYLMYKYGVRNMDLQFTVGQVTDGNYLIKDKNSIIYKRNKYKTVETYGPKSHVIRDKKFIDALEVCTRAVSLGTVDTLVSHPASMTHYGIPHAERIKYGITDGLIRMSVGIENYEDLEADLAQALSKI